jgi:DNA-binding transcriptional ArsR family regulator
LTATSAICNNYLTCYRRVDITDSLLSGDELLRTLAALSNPLRLRIMAALAPGRNYVSQLARELGISRPLLYLHLRQLEAAGLVKGTLELSADGKAMKYFEVAPFLLELTPAAIAEAVKTLTEHEAAGAQRPEEQSEEVR